MRQVRLGRRGRVRDSAAAGVSFFRLSPFLPLDLYASAGQFSAVRPAAGARIGPYRERFESKSLDLPAGGSDQAAVGALHGGILHRQMGAATRIARKTAGPRHVAAVESAALFACASRDVRRGLRAGIIFSAEGSWPGTGN